MVTTQRRPRSHQVALGLGFVILAIVGAAVVAALMPKDHVICGRGHVLNRIAQAFMERLGAGHIDGPTANYCAVPSTAGWLMAAAVLLGLLTVAVVLARRRRSLTPVAP